MWSLNCRDYARGDDVFMTESMIDYVRDIGTT